MDLARDLLSHYDGLLDTDRHSLCGYKALRASKHVHLQAGLEFGRRYLATRLNESTPGYSTIS